MSHACCISSSSSACSPPSMCCIRADRCCRYCGCLRKRAIFAHLAASARRLFIFQVRNFSTPTGFFLLPCLCLSIFNLSHWPQLQDCRSKHREDGGRGVGPAQKEMWMGQSGVIRKKKWTNGLPKWYCVEGVLKKSNHISTKVSWPTGQMPSVPDYQSSPAVQPAVKGLSWHLFNRCLWSREQGAVRSSLLLEFGSD